MMRVATITLGVAACIAVITAIPSNDPPPEITPDARKAARMGMEFLNTGIWPLHNIGQTGGCPASGNRWRRNSLGQYLLKLGEKVPIPNSQYCVRFHDNSGATPPGWNREYWLYEFYVPFTGSPVRRVLVEVNNEWQLTGRFWYTDNHYGDKVNGKRLNDKLPFSQPAFIEDFKPKEKLVNWKYVKYDWKYVKTYKD